VHRFGSDQIIVDDVHADILHPHDIKGIGGKRQGERAGLVHVDAVIQACEPVERLCAGTLIGGKFDAIHATAGRVSEHAGGTSQPSADIEHANFGAYLC
jgi:hypothetical protein